MSERLPPGVLITRPEPAAHETARIVERLGFTPVLAPMLRVEPHAWVRPIPAVQAILITSANAVPSLSGCDRNLIVMAVGDATAACASAAGFTNVQSAGRDATALAELVGARCNPEAGALLLASGEGQGLELAASLRRRGFVVQRRVAYSARPARTIPEVAERALATNKILHALFFSAASARAFVACIDRVNCEVGNVEALAISHQTARALTPLPWRCIRVASHPNQDELVALLS